MGQYEPPSRSNWSLGTRVQLLPEGVRYGISKLTYSHLWFKRGEGACPPPPSRSDHECKCKTFLPSLKNTSKHPQQQQPSIKTTGRLWDDINPTDLNIQRLLEDDRQINVIPCYLEKMEFHMPLEMIRLSWEIPFSQITANQTIVICPCYDYSS